MALERSAPLLELPGAFVLGSNDYYGADAEEPGPLPAAGHRPPRTWAPGCRPARPASPG